MGMLKKTYGLLETGCATDVPSADDVGAAELGEAGVDAVDVGVTVVQNRPKSPQDVVG
jgi:hypothetical protein